MANKDVYLGKNRLKTGKKKVTGQMVEIEHEQFYRIGNYHEMPDFFMSIVSDADHWMFISSNGALSAGRKNRDHALFPYYTDDKIHDYRGITGSKTFLLIENGQGTYLWEPFTDSSARSYEITRNIYKSVYGNKVIFEEINHDLETSFRYGWYNSNQYGFVKRSTLVYHGNQPVKATILDGIGNILPHGVDYNFQNEYSNLLDAYKKNELLTESKLGLFMLSSIPVDRAEPSETLMTTTVWSTGPSAKTTILLSGEQVENFTRGILPEEEVDVRARRGAYYVYATLEPEQDTEQEWLIIAEVDQDSADVKNLEKYIRTADDPRKNVMEDVVSGTEKLMKIVAAADGLQHSNKELSCARHFSNTMFNIMRGGIFYDNYTIDRKGFSWFVQHANEPLYIKWRSWLEKLPEKNNLDVLIDETRKTGNRDLERLAYEYLPLTFSRRHGDPSRPWNRFSIENKNSDGTTRLGYEGNWRDIFQNWEALGFSYPEFIDSMITRFLNASTADGYNPYRITSEGIDWECPDPNDPWAYIGYWGDHQIIYLQKLLELSEHYHPQRLATFMDREIFVHAHVPYRIKEFDHLVKNPQDTITFDHRLNDEITSLAGKIGSDARLKGALGGQLERVNMTEKILITLLAKLSNFIPEAGIWLNTQRPEWNDANNALVGNGASMVTLCYLRRFIAFFEKQFNNAGEKEYNLTVPVNQLFHRVFSLLNKHDSILEKGFTDAERLAFTAAMGQAGNDYRRQVYSDEPASKPDTLSAKELQEFMSLTLRYIDQSIRVNRRNDGLYHAYNLVSFNGDGISIRNLYEMLEGQVAVLSSGLLSPSESLEVLDALKVSKLFRNDQYSYLLYPDRNLPRFEEKNKVTPEEVRKSPLLSKLAADGNDMILKADKNGEYHFRGHYRNRNMLVGALDELRRGPYADLAEKDRQAVLDLYESLFDHQSFTGRSGTFYGYEGLGSIYWHMVSKLLLATEECFYRAVDEGAASLCGRIKDHYYEIQAGIGLSKEPELYGAFPTDAYSHTPGNAGVKQPGMTGQVKEDFLSRMGELGVRVIHGQLGFDPSLMNHEEFVVKEEVFNYIDIHGDHQKIKLEKDQLSFTVCQVPVIYIPDGKEKITIKWTNGRSDSLKGLRLTREISEKIFARDGSVTLLECHIPAISNSKSNTH